MTDRDIQALWQAVFRNDPGRTFQGTGDGVLSTMIRGGINPLNQATSAGVINPGSRIISGGAAKVGEGGVWEPLLGGIPIAGGLLRYLLHSEQAEEPTQISRFKLPPAIRMEESIDPNHQINQSASYEVNDSRSPEPTVVINISAMDSASILDRSDDIAKAVRQAMLTYHPMDDLWR